MTCAFFSDDVSTLLTVSKGQNITKRFEETTANASVNVNTLEPHKLYPIIRANRIPTKYGLSFVLTPRITETNIVQVFLPKRYSNMLSDVDINAINSKAVSLHLVYKGVCESSKSYLYAPLWFGIHKGLIRHVI